MKPLRHGVITLLLAAVVLPGIASASSIGLYADQNGGTCSFSGNASGLVTAYVVVKPTGPGGLTGVRFAAPIPACLGATLVSETAAPGMFSLGQVESGVSIGFTYCATEPTFAYQIDYMRSSTDPCCAYPIVPDPVVGYVQAVDCSFAEITIPAHTARFNADESCPCLDGEAPHPPHSPSPPDLATWVSTATTLSWLPSQYDGDIVAYDVYFGTTTAPPFVNTVTSPAYQSLPALQPNTHYYWRIVVRDVEGFSTSGPLWRFTTTPNNLPPSIPSNPTPPNNAINQPTSLTLTWVCSDPNGDPVLYDVYFGTVSPPPLLVADLGTPSVPVSALATGIRYYWRVVAHDSFGAATGGPEWNFQTFGPNQPPNTPVVVSPGAGVTNVAINQVLQWTGSDPEGDALRYDVYFGTSSPPLLASSNQTSTLFSPGTMAFLTTFYWRIVARDAFGSTTSGPVWSFTTRANAPPAAPFSPQPANGTTNITLTPTLAWSSNDEFYTQVRYDVYFGTSNPPPLVASNITTRQYNPGQLALSTAYFWRVVARDTGDLETSGPTWLFTTVTNPIPANPSPPNNGLGASPLVLQWTTSDPLIRPILCDVYFGTTNPPPLVATDVASPNNGTSFSYSPGGTVVAGAIYYWRVFAHTTAGGAMGPMWSFTGGVRGDINGDLALTVADASCALQVAIGNTACAAPGSLNLGDVNCAPGITPRDALCIHRRAIGGSCTFCGELAPGPVLFPFVTRVSLTQVGSTLTAVLAVSGVPTLEAFSFWVRHPINVQLTAALRRSPTGAFTAMEFRSTASYAQVGAYSLDAVNASGTTEFIELRFQLGGALVGSITADSFADDLAGAGTLLIASAGGGKGGENPVIFSRFDAAADGDGVRIGWELHSDDVIEGYTIYRGGENGAPTVAIVEGEPDGATGSYVDRTVQPGLTYRYEMAVRVAGGDEFRSQTVTVAMPGDELALGMNHPNPFNPQTTIPYVIPMGGAPVRVRLAIYDTSGRLVRTLVNENQGGGARNVVWNGDGNDGKTVTSGVYFSVLQVGNERRTRKMVLLK